MSRPFCLPARNGPVAQSVYRSWQRLTGGLAGPWGQPELF
jgi:hypothetical protein